MYDHNNQFVDSIPNIIRLKAWLIAVVVLYTLKLSAFIVKVRVYLQQ